MSSYYLVIEHYPDGGKWHHNFLTRRQAEEAIQLLAEAHAGRAYEIHEIMS